MVRTLVTLPDEDKAWLEERAREEGVSMAEMIRRAVHSLRSESPADRLSTQELLARTAGIHRGGKDGLAMQRRLRREWDGRC
ncbi:MAG TPA: CopG family transcriptional regulator [Thermoanaerobaculia bacterium]|nr:CopG family transcriptional regulator [Thermoanaerobaculia bacterium]